VSAVAVGLVIASGIGIWMLRQGAIADTIADNHRLGVVLAEQTARAFQAVDLALQEVSEKIGGGDVRDAISLKERFGGRDVYEVLARRLINLPQADTITITDSSGHLINQSRTWPPPDYSLADRDYFRHFAETPDTDPYISEPNVNRGSGASSVFLARRITGPHGTFLGVVVAPIRLDYFATFFARTGFSDGTGVTILRRDGTVLVRFPAEGVTTGAHMPHNFGWYETVAKGGGSYRSPGAFANLDASFVSVHPTPLYPIVVDVTRKDWIAFARWRQQAIAIGLGVLVVTITLALLSRALVRQITLIQDQRDRVRASEANYRDLAESTHDAMTVFEMPSGRFISANSSTLRMLGVADEQELFSRKPWDYSPERQPDGRLSAETAREMIEMALRKGSHFFEWTHARSDGTQFPTDVLFTSVRRGNGALIYATMHDTTERKRTDEQIARMAHYDNLTGLANRAVFIAALEREIARAQRGDESFAVLYLDLDHFKDVNDTLGHPVGDLLLRTVAERLRGSVRAGDIVARFGGDEFAILVSDINDFANAAIVSERALEAAGQPATFRANVAAVAAGITEKIVTALTEPVTIENNRIHSGASVGIAVYGPDSPDAEAMLAHADVALYRAKAEQRGSHRFFSGGMDAEVRARVNMSIELREALASRQFILMYQPQVEILTGRIVGLEALVRWDHPTLGLVGPGKFIPEAERNGLIVPLGRWIMREACRQVRQWLDAGTATPSIAVNLSAVQFRTSFGLEKDIAATLAEFELAPRLLELELTESVLMEASRDHNALLSRLRERGHGIAIDDFGIGYSSLDYLRRYPVDRIKIAQTFITDIGVESGSDAIVRAGLGLARELNIEVVVEGVETADQLALLKSWGARIVQGYYFAKPMLAGKVSELLRVGKITPAHTEMIEIAV
jgi:diguanylate cyclase (GGDEF)-like protein/PAS domain S-box-containing protein